jgi:hypothetical protein
MAFLPTQDKIGRLMGTYLTNTIPSSRRIIPGSAGQGADNCVATPIIYSWVAANFAGHTKKVTVNAMLLMLVSCGAAQET